MRGTAQSSCRPMECASTIESFFHVPFLLAPTFKLPFGALSGKTVHLINFYLLSTRKGRMYPTRIGHHFTPEFVFWLLNKWTERVRKVGQTGTVLVSLPWFHNAASCSALYILTFSWAVAEVCLLQTSYFTFYLCQSAWQQLFEYVVWSQQCPPALSTEKATQGDWKRKWKWKCLLGALIVHNTHLGAMIGQKQERKRSK